MLAAVVVCVAAGRWQQGRMHDKERCARNGRRAADGAVASRPAGAADWAALRYRPVVVAGAYRAAAQISSTTACTKGAPAITW